MSGRLVSLQPNASVHPPLEQLGFWGSPTSTVDWCESNYAVSRYIAEFFNTTSSLVILAVALFGGLLHYRGVERRFTAAFAALGVVGVGSTAFHATLRFELQLLDELPMLYTALILVYVLVENRASRRFGKWFLALLLAHGVLVTVLTAWTRSSIQFYLFHASFGSLELFALVSCIRIGLRQSSQALRRVFHIGIGSYVLGIVLWFIDLKYCSLVSFMLPGLGLVNPQLHAVWHVLVALGFYHLLVLLMFDRSTTLGQSAQLRRRFWLPVVVH
ncbi:MAG: ceramidase [Polyangiaceae bacterium]|nr:ceramidase [Polyangiaceae bacterium]